MNAGLDHSDIFFLSSASSSVVGMQKSSSFKPVAKLTPIAAKIYAELRKQADPKRVPDLQRFFKTEKGSYGEGDQFMGLMNPQLHALAKEYCDKVTYDDVKQLVVTPYNDQRFLCFALLRGMYEKQKRKKLPGIPKETYEVFKSLLVPYCNNWNLIDCFVPHIIGDYLVDRPKSEHKFLSAWVDDDNMWRRRAAVISTFPFIKKKQFDMPLDFCRRLLEDKEDLMHKMCGWTLREVGRQDRKVLTGFLDKHTAKMPRTMLRYAIEHFDKPLKDHYMNLPSEKKGNRADGPTVGRKTQRSEGDASEDAPAKKRQRRQPATNSVKK